MKVGTDGSKTLDNYLFYNYRQRSWDYAPQDYSNATYHDGIYKYGEYSNRRGTLQNMEASFDLYVPKSSAFDMVLRLIDGITKDTAENTNNYETIASFSVSGSGEDKAYKAQFRNGSGYSNVDDMPMDKWVTVSIQLDFAQDKYDVWYTYDGEDHLVADDFVLRKPTVDGDGVVTPGSGLGGDYLMSSVRFGMAETSDEYTMYFDNFKISTKENTYGAVIAEEDFDVYTTGTTIDSNNNPGKKFFIEDTAAAQIIEDGGRKCAKLTVTSTTNAFGLSDATTQAFLTSHGYTKYPDKIKVAFDIKKTSTSNTAVYCFIGNSNPAANGNGEIMLWGSGKNFQFSRTANQVTSSTTVAYGNWVHIDMYIDFAARNVVCYVDGTYVGRAGLKSTVLSPEYLSFASGAADNLYIDNIKISAPTPYADGSKPCAYVENIVENTITKELGKIKGDEMRIGYVINNASGESAQPYTVFKAKFDSLGQSLLDFSSEDSDTVAAGKLDYRSIPYPLLATGNFKYFVWDGFDNIVPLTEPLSINK